jgi:hypothetical protein
MTIISWNSMSVTFHELVLGIPYRNAAGGNPQPRMKFCEEFITYHVAIIWLQLCISPRTTLRTNFSIPEGHG